MPRWLILCLLLSSQALADDPAEAVARTALRVCADPANPPFSNQAGEGFENKIAALFAAQMGLPLEYVFYPDSVGFIRNTLRARRCDLVMGSVSGAEMVQSTNPYYRSTYVMVTRVAEGIAADRIADPALRDLTIGLIAGTPPATAVAEAGYAAKVRPYPLFVDTRVTAPGARMIDDLAAGRIDVALLWGPIAGHHAARYPGKLRLTPLLQETARMDYYITMAVRPGENIWKNQINELIRAKQGEIDQILRAGQVPLLDAQGEMVSQP